METLSERIEREARAVIATWILWCDAEGWDNPEWDSFAEALNELADTLEMNE